MRLADAPCSVCRKGHLRYESSEPTNRPMGHTKRYYRRDECRSVGVETCDNRFLGSLNMNPDGLES